jgi:hypothetical protein
MNLRLIVKETHMLTRKKEVCTLVQVTPKNGKMSFIFKSDTLKKNPMRTCKMVNSALEVQSLFDTFTKEILGKTIDLVGVDADSLAHLMKEHARGKKFELEIEPSACGKYTDILSIKAL